MNKMLLYYTYLDTKFTSISSYRVHSEMGKRCEQVLYFEHHKSHHVGSFSANLIHYRYCYTRGTGVKKKLTKIVLQIKN